MKVIKKLLGVILSEIAFSEDLGGSSKIKKENFED